jgi:dimethylargininase
MLNTTNRTHGLVREVSRSLASCELQHIQRQEFDLAEARRQHAAYVDALRKAGVEVALLPEEPELPDSVFVEDAAIFLDELAILCRPGVPSRQAEVGKIEAYVEPIRPVRRITPPGTLEGGDVLRIGRTFYVGKSSRTNADGIGQFQKIVSPLGYRVITVDVKGCLHLKTGATSPARGLLLVNAHWIDESPFFGFELLRLPPEEPWGANTLTVNGTVMVSESAPKTADLLEKKGLRVFRLDISELQKAEAGLTCLSILYSV